MPSKEVHAVIFTSTFDTRTLTWHRKEEEERGQEKGEGKGNTKRSAVGRLVAKDQRAQFKHDKMQCGINMVRAAAVRMAGLFRLIVGRFSQHTRSIP